MTATADRTDTAPDDLSAVLSVNVDDLDLAGLQQSMTPRQIGAWEHAAGMQWSEFPPTYLAMLLVWWGANQAGHPMTPDEALDLTDEDAITRWTREAIRRMGPTTGVAQLSATPSVPSSSTSPSSPTPTTSPSASSAT